MTSPCCFEPRDHRGLDGDRLPEAIDAAPARGPKRSGGWRRRDFLASRGMGEAQGKKVAPPPLRLRRSRRSRPTARSSHGEAVGRTPNSILGRSRGQPEGSCKGSRLTGRRDGGHGTEKGSFVSEANRSRQTPPTWCSSTAPGADCRSAPTRVAFLRVRNTIFAAQRRQPGDQEGEVISAFGRAAATQSASELGLPRDLPVRRRDGQRQAREGGDAGQNGAYDSKCLLPSASRTCRCPLARTIPDSRRSLPARHRVVR